jgi:hypothetical protein
MIIELDVLSEGVLELCMGLLGPEMTERLRGLE